MSKEFVTAAAILGAVIYLGKKKKEKELPVQAQPTEQEESSPIPPLTQPDVPSALEIVDSAPDVILENIKEPEIVQEKFSPPVQPILPAPTDFRPEDKIVFPQVDMIDNGEVTYTPPGQTLRVMGYSKSLVEFYTKQNKDKIIALNNEIEKANLNVALLTPLDIDLGTELVNRLSGPNENKEFVSAVDFQMPFGTPVNATTRSGRWAEIYNKLKDEYARLKTVNMSLFYSERNTDSAMANKKYSEGGYNVYASDYNEVRYSFLSTLINLMNAYESTFWTPWASMYSYSADPYAQSKTMILTQKSYVTSYLNSAKDTLLKNSGTDPEQIKNELRLKIIPIEAEINRLKKVTDYFELCKAQIWFKQKYVDYYYGEYDPSLEEQLDKEISDAKLAFYENEMVLKEVKINNFATAKTDEQMEYVVNKALTNIFIDFLSSLKAKKNEKKYVENGKYKLSELENSGYKGTDALPIPFIQWANIPFSPAFPDIAKTVMIELFQLISYKNDPRNLVDLKNIMKPLLSEFDFLYQQAVINSNNPNAEINYLNQSAYMKPVHEMAKKIQSASAPFRTLSLSAGSLGPAVLPRSFYLYYMSEIVDSDMVRVLGEPSPVAKKKMQDIIAEKQEEFFKCFPDSGLNLLDLKDRAFYLHTISKDIAKFESWINVKMDALMDESIKRKISQAENGEQIVDNELDSKVRVLSILASTLPINEIIGRLSQINTAKESRNADLSGLLKWKESCAAMLAESMKDSSDIGVLYSEFLQGALIPFIDVCYAARKKLYSYKTVDEAEFLRQKLFENAKASLDIMLIDKTYPLPKGEYLFPRYGNLTSNPSLDYSKILNVDLIIKFMESASNPIGKTNTALLLMPLESYELDAKQSLDIYIKLCAKNMELRDLNIRSNKLFTEDSEFAFYNFLLMRLLTVIRFNYDVRNVVTIVNGINGGWGAGKIINNNPIPTNLSVEVYPLIARLEAFKAKTSNLMNFIPYEPTWLWERLLAQKDADKVLSVDFVSKSYFNDNELEFLKYGIADAPSVSYVAAIAKKKGMTLTEAITYLQPMIMAYASFVQGRKVNNPEINHENWNSKNPALNDMLSDWFSVKTTLTKLEGATYNQFFTELADYCLYWDKNQSDKDWQGQYAHIFKSDSPRNKQGNLSGLYETLDSTMGGLKFKAPAVFKAPAKVIAKPLKMAFDPIKKTYEKVEDIVQVVLTKVDKFTLSSPLASIVKDKFVYKIMPESFVDKVANVSHIPGHLISGEGISKKDLIDIAMVAVAVYTGGTLEGTFALVINYNFEQKLLDEALRDSVIQDVNQYTGGVLSSYTNLHRVPQDVAENKKIDKQYVLMRTIDAVIVGGAVAGAMTGGATYAVGVGASALTNYLLDETNVLENEYARKALSVAVQAAVTYSMSASAASATVATEAGTTAATGAGTTAATSAGQSAAVEGSKSVAKVTATQALQSAATQQAKAEAVNATTKVAVKETFLGKSEVGRSALMIGVVATVSAIDAKAGARVDAFSKTAVEQAKLLAIQHAEKMADEQLTKVDPNLTVANLKKLYALKDKDLAKIIDDARTKFEQDIKSGKIKEQVLKEVDRFVERKVKEVFSDLVEKYGEMFLKYLMEKFGIQWDYDPFIQPEDYLLYMNWLVVYQKRGEDRRIFQYTYERPWKKYAMIGGGVGALALAYLSLD